MASHLAEDNAQAASRALLPFGVRTHSLGRSLGSKILVLDPAVRDQRRNLDGEPRPHPEGHRVRNPKVRHVARPQWPEVRVEADLPSPIHLLCLPVELGQGKLRRGPGVADGQLEFQLKLVLEQFVHVPHLARPSGPHRIGLDPEPLVAGLLVHLLVRDQCHVLLLHPRDPLLAVARTRLLGQHGKLLHGGLGVGIDRHLHAVR
mmetsp:Transcript_63631/g.174704  ORF Transcript_63631/g.174704 Transcript_63631/m.174704 type:complete len:204 (-) Transcript_63631:14-625(-)